MKAFEERHQRLVSRIGRQQPFELLGAHHHDGVLAADADTLRTVAAGASDDLAEARLRILELPRGGARAEFARRLNTPAGRPFPEIGRAQVCTPVTNAHLVCRLLLAK